MTAIHAHCGDKGHSAYSPTLALIVKEYFWEDMKVDIKKFIHSCIHCIMSRKDERILSPISTALHGERSNKMIHTDFIYMEPVKAISMNYVFIIKDDKSSYTRLYPSDNVDGDAANTTIGK